MRKWFFLFALSVLSKVCFGQFVESFSDSNLFANPAWNGDTAHFEITDTLNLHLDAPAASSKSFLSTNSLALANASWEFKLSMDFNPSSANNFSYVLTADSLNLTSNYTGYFVTLGGTKDNVTFYKNIAGSKTSLFSGPEDMFDKNNIECSVKITNDSIGNWRIYADTSGGKNYQFLGSVFDNEILHSRFSGFICSYTSTRSDKFWIDDITVTGEPYPDIKPPTVLTHALHGDSTLEIIFSETIQDSLLLSFSPTIPYVVSINKERCYVSFANSLTNGQLYTCYLTGVQDSVGNHMMDTSIVFQHLITEQAAFKDIVINEVYADPTPSFGLPGYEYLELFNRSDKMILMEEWILVNSTKTITLPSILIPPKQYIILSNTAGHNELSPYGSAFAVSGWIALTNDTDALELRKNDSTLIDNITYHSSWHDPTKKDGGFSLELIDPNVHCSISNNWKSSAHPIGGTPGAENSVYQLGYDTIAPVITDIMSVSDSLIVLKLSEYTLLDPINISSESNIQFNDITLDSLSNTLYITTSKLEPKTKYDIKLSIWDCSYNVKTTIIENMVLPEKAVYGDIVLNEILFNPFPNNYDFVELYNASDKHLNLQAIKLASVKADDTLFSEKLTVNYHLFAPNEYLYIGENTSAIALAYPVGAAGIEVHSLPAYNDDNGHVLLLDSALNKLDEVVYSEKDHAEVLRNVEGISLEKINPLNNNPNTEVGWHSASSSSGYATPGMQNSHYNIGVSLEDELYLTNNKISPDNDGLDDFLEVHLKTSAGIANIQIFSVNGTLISNENNLQITGNNNVYYWDGTSKDGNIAMVGNYILFIELALETGEFKQFKKAFAVVATR